MSAQLHSLNNIAVLIDADNASAKNIGRILLEIEKLGHISCKKIYGDWGNAHIQSWQEALLRYAIDPMQQFAYAKGKNATDIGMVIEAMDLLYSQKYDGFCLVSSDSDFTSLALRIRKNRVKVFGFGKRNTVDAFAKSCDRFYYVEDLLNAQSTVNSPVRSLTNNKSLNNKNSTNKATDSISKRWTTKQLQTQTHLIGALNKILKENPSAQNNWSNLSYLASQLSQNYENIKLDKYGYAKFSDLIIALRLYDIRRQPNGIWAKLKVQKSGNASTVGTKKASSQASIDKSVSDKSASNLFPAIATTIKITYAPTIDAVLFRVNVNKKVRGDEDMIFYGQTHSEDGTIELDQGFEGDKSIAEFSCDLSRQPKDIDELVFVLSNEVESLASDPHQAPIVLTITDSAKNDILFNGEFGIQNKSGQSLLLFTLSRKNKLWEFKPKHQNIDGDLRDLCKQYGIEISDD